MLKQVISGAALSLFVVGSAQALSLSDVTGGDSADKSKAASSASSTDASAAQDQLSKAYVAAGKEVLLAQGSLANAVGLKELGAKAKATAEALTEGATKGNLEDADKVQSDTSAAIENALKDSNTKIDAAGKKSYTEGLMYLGKGMLRYVGLRSNAMSFKDAAQAQLTSASLTDKLTLTNKFSTGTYIVSELPSHVSRLGSTIKAASDYAKSHSIPVPKDATAALSKI